VTSRCESENSDASCDQFNKVEEARHEALYSLHEREELKNHNSCERENSEVRSHRDRQRSETSHSHEWENTENHNRSESAEFEKLNNDV